MKEIKISDDIKILKDPDQFEKNREKYHWIRDGYFRCNVCDTVRLMEQRFEGTINGEECVCLDCARLIVEDMGANYGSDN